MCEVFETSLIQGAISEAKHRANHPRYIRQFALKLDLSVRSCAPKPLAAVDTCLLRTSFDFDILIPASNAIYPTTNKVGSVAKRSIIEDVSVSDRGVHACSSNGPTRSNAASTMYGSFGGVKKLS